MILGHIVIYACLGTKQNLHHQLQGVGLLSFLTSML